MMKQIKYKYIKTVFFILAASLYSNSQSIERSIIGSAGNTFSNNGITMQFTVGEVAVSSMVDGSTTLQQGFHQGTVKLAIKISPRVFLQGALLGSVDDLMRDNLRESDVPLTSPYADRLTCDVSVFADGGSSGEGTSSDNIVDWIFVELRNKNDATNIVASSSALLQRDGDVVEIDGVSNLSFDMDEDDYYVVIKHRSHLGVMSANAVSLSKTTTTLDFTDANNQITYGTNAQSTFGAPADKLALWAGNVNGDNTVIFQGSGDDVSAIKDNVVNEAGNTSGSNFYQYIAYDLADVDMNSIVIYQGTGNDSEIIKDIIRSHPENQSSPSNFFIITEQLPNNILRIEANRLFNQRLRTN